MSRSEVDTTTEGSDDDEVTKDVRTDSIVDDVIVVGFVIDKLGLTVVVNISIKGIASDKAHNCTIHPRQRTVSTNSHNVLIIVFT